MMASTAFQSDAFQFDAFGTGECLTAFQSDAFQNKAFEICNKSRAGGGSGGRRRHWYVVEHKDETPAKQAKPERKPE
jgi:hypothetical protein